MNQPEENENCYDMFEAFTGRSKPTTPQARCEQIARDIVEEWKDHFPTDPDLRERITSALLAAAALQSERDKLASVEESARRVIEQAVQVLATRPITGERHIVLTELEAWLAEHLAPVKPCPEDEGEK